MDYPKEIETISNFLEIARSVDPKIKIDYGNSGEGTKCIQVGNAMHNKK